MGLRTAVLVVIAISTLPALASCGGGDREVTSDDLPNIVLQRTDVDIGEMREATLNQGSASAVYGHEFEVPPEDAAAGDLVCVTAVLALHRSEDSARDAFANALQEFGRMQAASEEGALEVERATAPNIGEDAIGYHLSGPLGVFCSGYENQPFDEHIVYFYDQDVIGIITVVNLAGGSTPDEANRLAELQASRLELFYAGELRSPD